MIERRFATKMAFFCCCLAIILISVPTVRGQVPTDAQNQLDSILLTGDPEAAAAFWSTVCSPATADTSEASCGITAERLQALLDFVAVLKAQEPAYIGKVIADGRSQSAKYRESYVGPSAAGAFRAFLGAADSDNWLKAIVYIRIARFFEIRFFERTLAEAHSSYARAEKYFGEGKYELADTALKAILYDPGNHPTLLAYADTISYLQQRVDRKLLEIKSRQYYLGRTAPVASRLSFSISARLILQPGRNAFPLVMSNANSTIRIEVDRISPASRFGLGLQAWYQLSERTSIGVGLDAAEFVYSSMHTLQLIFFDFDVTYYRAFVGGRYLLRSAVGLRPYLNLELGAMQYKYDQINCEVKLGSSEYQTYQVAAGDFSSGVAAFTLGMQFVPNSDSRWAITSELSLYVQSKEHTFLPMPSTSMSMRLDFLI